MLKYFNTFTALANNWEETQLHVIQSENYFTVEQQPLQIYIALNSCKI